MYSRQASRLFVAVCGAAAVLSVAACGNNANNASDRTAKADQPAAATTPASDANASRTAEQQHVNLTGCLQRGDGGSYILTEMNTPEGGRVASSDNPSGNRVEKEQVREAQHAYRLNADNKDDLDKLVGARVRVEGTVAERSDLRAGASDRDRAQDRSVGTSGDKDRDRNKSSNTNEKIDSSNLARVNVASIEKISDGCAERGAGKKPAAKR